MIILYVGNILFHLLILAYPILTAYTYFYDGISPYFKQTYYLNVLQQVRVSNEFSIDFFAKNTK